MASIFNRNDLPVVNNVGSAMLAKPIHEMFSLMNIYFATVHLEKLNYQNELFFDHSSTCSFSILLALDIRLIQNNMTQAGHGEFRTKEHTNTSGTPYQFSSDFSVAPSKYNPFCFPFRTTVALRFLPCSNQTGPGVS